MNKRFLSLTAFIVLILAMLAAATTAFAYDRVYSNCGNGKPLNVRSDPGKQYPVINSFPYEAEICVL